MAAEAVAARLGVPAADVAAAAAAAPAVAAAIEHWLLTKWPEQEAELRNVRVNLGAVPVAATAIVPCPAVELTTAQTALLAVGVALQSTK